MEDESDRQKKMPRDTKEGVILLTMSTICGIGINALSVCWMLLLFIVGLLIRVYSFYRSYIELVCDLGVRLGLLA
jgi:hypothetical protein